MRIPPISRELKTKILKYSFISAIALAIIALSFFRVFDIYENTLLDFRFRFRPVQKFSKDIAIIEISDDTLNQLGTWPIPRDFHASLIDVLKVSGVRQVMFDIIFVEPTDVDGILKESIKKAGNVYLPYVFNLKNKSSIKKIPKAKSYIAPLLSEFKIAAKGSGHINTYKDFDGKNRWTPMLVRFKGKLYPHITIQMACDQMGVSCDDIKVKRNKIVVGDKISIPTLPDGSVLVNYAGRWSETYKHFSYIDILQSFNAKLKGTKPRIDLNELKGKICFVGLTATGTSDLYPIPLENNYPMVGLHANILNSILLRRHIYRASRFINLMLLFALIVIVLSVMSKKIERPLGVFLITLGYLSGFALLGFLLFIFAGVWIDIFCPLAVALILYVGLSIYNFLEANRRHALVEKELSIAKTIQESFLPEPIDNFDSLDIIANMKTAKHVGGDLYDMQQISKYKFGIFIGDVSGKGVPAALVMAKTISLFRMCVANTDEPSDLLFQINEQMSQEMPPGIFVTATYLIYVAGQRKVMIASAGHSPTLIIRKKEGIIEEVSPAEGMPLGLMEQVEFSQEEIVLGEGDKIVLYTDGISEAKNLKREEFGEDRLKSILVSTKNLGVKETASVIQKEVTDFAGKAPQHDDYTIVVLNEKGDASKESK